MYHSSIIDNVTVPAGRNVRMACSVKNLGSFKVINKIFSYKKCYFYVHFRKLCFLIVQIDKQHTNQEKK